MAAGLNLHIAIGHLGQNSELRYTQKPTPVVSFRIACGERYRNASGEWQEHTEWVNAVLFGKRAEGLAPFLLKGTRVCIVGSQRTRSYVSQKDGQTRYVTETRISDVVLLSTPEGRQIQNEGAAIGQAVVSAMANNSDILAPSDADSLDDFA